MNPDGSGDHHATTAVPVDGRYRFGPVVVDPAAHLVLRDGAPQPVEPKAYAVLLVLLGHAGELLTHDQLLDAVWGHRHVTPGVLTRAIAQLRAALGDDPHKPRFIQTHHALGYRFIGELDVQGGAGAAGPAVGDGAMDGERAGAEGTEAGATAVEGTGEGSAPGGRDERPRSLTGVAQDHPLPAPPATGPARPATAIAAAALPDAAEPARSPLPRWRRSTGWRHGPHRVLLPVLALLLAVAALLWSYREQLPLRRPAAASIAVLPFTSLSSGRGDDGYFAEGLSVEMQGALAGVPGLQVAARSSAAAAARRDTDVRSIGRTLGVATVLDASVRREGRRVRIDARLSDTRSGYVLWSQSYDREIADVFAVQTEIASEVARALLGVLPPAPAGGERLGRRLAPTDDVGAYEAYLKGLQQLHASGDDAQLQRAIGFFGEALVADAGFARAQAGICRAEIMRFENARDAPAFDRAQAACLRAARMDPQLREVSLALGEMHRVRGEFARADAHYRRALQDVALRPLALVGLARSKDAQGDHELALKYLDQARRLRPADAVVHRELGYHHYLNGRLDAAIASFRTAALLLPDDPELWANLGGLHLAAGETEQAAQAFERSLAIEPTYAALSNLGTLRYQQGAHAEAAGLYRRATELDEGDFRLWGNLGDALVASGEAPAAREPYRQATGMATDYVQVRPGDAEALALLAWYHANLGEAEMAVQRLRQSGAMAGSSGEVAFFNAQTLALLGDRRAARRWMSRAREAGVSQQRIEASPLLRGLARDGEREGGAGGVRER